MSEQSKSLFFGFPEGPNQDYNHNKTSEHRANVREYCDELLAHHLQFCGDPHFCREASEQPLQRWWEMYVSWLMGTVNNLSLLRASSNAPDVCVDMKDGRKLWIEAISVTPGTGNNEVTRPPIGQVGTLPVDKIVLRYTSGFAEKAAKIKTYIKAGVIGPTDSVIIAINSGGMRDSDLADQDPPLAIKALFGVGDAAMRIPLRFTDKAVERAGEPEVFYPQQNELKKHNQV